MPEKYISYGGGVGSTGLILKMLPEVKAGDVEVIYAKTGADLPETDQYLDYLQQNLDLDITTVSAQESLYDFCWRHNTIPHRAWRWCTDKFKIRPILKYTGRRDEPCFGLTWDERWRARDFTVKGTPCHQPFVNQGISRALVLPQIEKADIKTPCKSGCFFCPFQSKERWRELFFNHPDLYEKAALLEERAMRNRSGNILSPTGRTLRVLEKEFREQAVLIKWVEL